MVSLCSSQKARQREGAKEGLSKIYDQLSQFHHVILSARIGGASIPVNREGRCGLGTMDCDGIPSHSAFQYYVGSFRLLIQMRHHQTVLGVSCQIFVTRPIEALLLWSLLSTCTFVCKPLWMRARAAGQPSVIEFYVRSTQ
jgi:hypothetical protein